ncbi:MAG: cell division protein FtsW [Ruminococcaceae bacterium]|nr:cell division protein FtsW [Oscillospiraceae bacterium]
MAERNENHENGSERYSGKLYVKRPVVSVGRIKKNDQPRHENTEKKIVEVSGDTVKIRKAKPEEQIKEQPKETLKEQSSQTERSAGKKIYESNIKKDAPGSYSQRSERTDVTEQKPLQSVGARLRDSRLGKILNDGGSASSGVMLHCGSVDIPLLMIFMILAGYGIIMVFSASYAYAYIKEDNSYAFVKNQIIYLLIGAFLATLIVCLYNNVLKRNWVKFFVLAYFAGALLLLGMIFIPGLGIKEGITRRWLDLGIISLQPSEFAKGALILALAMYYAKYEKKISTFKKRQGVLLQTIAPYGIAFVVVALVFAEMHLSGTIILVLISIIMVFTGEKNHTFTLVALLIGLLIVCLVIGYLMQYENQDLKDNAPGFIKKLVTHYSWIRIEAWLDPSRFEEKGDLWQSMQGLNAIGSGGFMGVGYGESRQKHLFVSQPQNDFVFTIVCEEMGFVGGAIVVILFLALMWRGYVVGKRIPDTFSRMAMWGLCVSIGMQAFLNMGVVTTLLPNTGISLPFFSYGGSSIISLMIEVGIILALSRYAQKEG